MCVSGLSPVHVPRDNIVEEGRWGFLEVGFEIVLTLLSTVLGELDQWRTIAVMACVIEAARGKARDSTVLLYHCPLKVAENRSPISQKSLTPLQMSTDASALDPSPASPANAGASPSQHSPCSEQRAPRTALASKTVPVASLGARTRDAAFELFREAYENTSRERFEHDLDEKQHIILLYDRASGGLKGFSTVHVCDIESPAGRATAVFSGDTVIDRQCWGQKQLQLAFARLLITLKLRAPQRPLYWFLVSKGYRTYLLLANAFPRAVPRFGRVDDPSLRAILDELATERFGDQYDRTRGLVRYATPHERVRDGIAPVTSSALINPHVRFFVERNKDHADGVELACLAEVRLIDLGRALARIARVKARRGLRGSSTP